MMKRFKFLALAAALAIPLAACDEGSQSTVVIEGSVVGVVSIEGVGQTGVTVTLSSGGSTTTDASGAYSFSGVKAGSYTVSITFQAGDVTFPSTSKGVVIQSAGETVTANFDGQYVRTSAISGVVSAGGAGLAGVQVTLGGTESGSATTDASGGYSFTGLRMGAYTVTISGFDANKYSFNSTSQSATLGSGASAALNFAGSENATGVVNATVTIDGAARSGVTLTLSTGDTEVTNSAGKASFSGLAKGTYSVTVTNPDSKNIDFENLSQNATIAEIGGSDDVTFVGTTIADAGISGTISNTDDGPYADFAVSLSNGDETTTDADGMYAFTGLESGSYTVTITNPDPANLIFDRTSVTVNVSNPNSVYVENFTSMYRADNSASGRVWFDLAVDGEFTSADEPAAGFDMSATNADLGMTIESETDVDGKYMFDGLRSGSWVISCVSCPAEMGGRVWTWTADTTVELSEGTVATADFLGVTEGYTNDMVGSLSIQTVGATFSGAWAFAGVDLTLVGPMIPGAGDPPTQTTTTDVDGAFSFEELQPGNYEVTLDVTTLPAGVSLVGSETVVVNVSDDLASTATVPPFMTQIDEYQISVPVHYGPEGSTAWNDGDRVAMYQSEELDGGGPLNGPNLIAHQFTDEGLVTYTVPAARVADDFVLYTCLSGSGATPCIDGIVQMGAAILADGIIEHNVRPLEPMQTMPEDHNMVYQLMTLGGKFIEGDDTAVPNNNTNNQRVLLSANLGFNTVDDPSLATFGDIADDIPGDGADETGPIVGGEGAGEFNFGVNTPINVTTDLSAPISVQDIADGIYFYVRGQDCDLRAGSAGPHATVLVNQSVPGVFRTCSGARRHLLDYAGDDTVYETYFFDGSAAMPVQVNDESDIVVSYPNQDIIFRAWHERNDVRGFQSGVGGDDDLELTDINFRIAWDRDDNGVIETGVDYGPSVGIVPIPAASLECVQADAGGDPTLIRCFTQMTNQGPVDLIDQADIRLFAVSNDAPNLVVVPARAAEQTFIDASIGFQGAQTIAHDGTLDIDLGTRPASEIALAPEFDGLRFSVNLGDDGFGWKFSYSIARVTMWNEGGSLVDSDNIRDEGADLGTEMPVEGVIVNIDPVPGALGVDPSGFPLSDQTVDNAGAPPAIPPAGPPPNAGVVEFRQMLEGNYVLTLAGTDPLVFDGDFVVVGRDGSGNITWTAPVGIADQLSLLATAPDTDPSVANRYEVQFTNGVISGYVFDNLDDDDVVDPNERSVGAGQIVELSWTDQNGDDQLLTTTADGNGFFEFTGIREDAGFDLELQDNGVGGLPMLRSAFDFLEVDWVGGVTEHLGDGTDLIDVDLLLNFDWEMSGSAAGATTNDTDLEMVHRDGQLTMTVLADADGAPIANATVNLTFCDLDAANEQTDIAGAVVGSCLSPDPAGPTTFTTNAAGQIMGVNLTEGFWLVEIAATGFSAGTATNPDTWVVRMLAQGDQEERTARLIP